MPDTVLLCYCTCPDRDSAGRIARALVDERLAACVSGIAAVRSTYRWQEAVHTDTEELLLIKTTAARLPALERRVLELHPYEVPELIAFEITDGLPAYLEWLASETATR